MAVDDKKKFHKSAELFRRIMKLVREGIWIVDRDGIITFVNPYLAELLGYSAREMTGKHWFDFMNVWGIAVCQKNLESRTNDITEQDDFELFKKDGTCVYTKLSMAPICEKDQYAGTIALVTDITECKRAAETLQLKQEELIAANQELRVQTARLSIAYQDLHDKTEEIRKYTAASSQAREEADQRFADQETILASERELLKVTLDSLGEGVVATDQNERIILINEAATRLTGYSRIEAIGEPLDKILYIIDDRTSEPRAKIVSHEIFNNLILVTRDLQEVPVSTDSSPIKTSDGVIVGTVTVFQDISEKLKTQQELLRAEKMESLGILAGGIAHDFNNVLAAILTNVQLVMVKLKSNADIKPYLTNTIETTRKASNLTKQLLTFSKGGAPVRKDTSLVELIKDTAEFVLRGASIKLEFTMTNDLWVTNIDEGQISQVIHNLVLNAKQAMPKGGIIYINAENLSIAEGTRFNPGNYVKITVRDQGTGIAKKNLLKIFDPYFTTKKIGSGLGLATSYSIIKQHDGYIEVESQLNVGTTFFIYLPASNMAVIPTETRTETAVTDDVFKILVMDDEAVLLNAMGEMLKYYGHRVVLTDDGVRAIELYKQAELLGEPFDVVIMDLTIPGGMGGQETIAILRDFDPQIKAIVSSGYATDPIMADYERFGFAGVVSKPYKINELNEVLQQVINSK